MSRFLRVKFDCCGKNGLRKGDICEYLGFEEAGTDPFTMRDCGEQYIVRVLKTNKVIYELPCIFEELTNFEEDEKK